MKRDEFGLRQAEMTARWAEGVKSRYGDPDSYYEIRRTAYLDRWREALRFIPNGSRVLDIGGGNGFSALFEMLKARDIDYWYVDVDPAAVDASREIGMRSGLNPEQFSHGYNDKLNFPDNQFDKIFSSHCIEHSFDLNATFSEIHRVLAPDGDLLMAVPFGWELNPEHPYFFGPDEWTALVEDAGFSIRIAQIGCEYPEQGHDYFIAARRIENRPLATRISPAKFSKPNYTFVPFNSPMFSFTGHWEPKDDHSIGLSGARCSVTLPTTVSVALPVLGRHSWSGLAELTWGDKTTYENLFSWFGYVQPKLVEKGRGRGDLTIGSHGSSLASFSDQIVVYGVLLPAPGN